MKKRDEERRQSHPCQSRVPNVGEAERQQDAGSGREREVAALSAKVGQRVTQGLYRSSF